jgi:hypothetical protein
LGPRAYGQADPSPVLVDRIIAVVGDRLVLQSEVELEREIASRSVYLIAALSSERTNAREWLVDMAIIRGLAGDVKVYQPASGDVVAAVERLKASYTDPADLARFYERFGIDEGRLDNLVYNRLVVERYIQRNIALGVTDEELASHYRSWITERRQTVAIRQIELRGEP